jgi:hypothetical protein
MTTIQTMLANVKAAYPGLAFEIVGRADTAHADDDRYPGEMVAVQVAGVSIVDPYFSSCGRFYVNPEAAHGIPRALADMLLHLNCSCTQSAFLRSTPAEYRFVHFHRITDELIAQAVAVDDLNDALFAFQCHIGIDAGDVASIVFCGAWEDEWPTATHPRRREMVDHYIEAERRYA